jgi:hypothetical protein
MTTPECKHVWTEEYCGWLCVPCGLFYAYGCAPWEDHDFDPDFDDGIRDEWDDEPEFDCGWVRGMGCTMAGSEECDWECPHRRDYERGMALTQARLAKREKAKQ